MTLPDEIADFEGRWQLARRIEDFRAGQVLEGRGTAILRPDADGHVYDEHLTLQVPGQAPMTATRRYLWRQEAGRIAIRFDDGRPFHVLALGQVRTSDHHDCPPDSYAAEYDFTDWPSWRVTWTVKGPRKSYVLHSRFRRAG